MNIKRMNVLIVLFVLIFSVSLVSASGDWSYYGDTGPDNWCHLDPAYAIACEGTEQSPINIETDDAVEADLPALNINYNNDCKLHVVNNGHTIKAGIETGDGVLTIGGVQYNLLQFHFHTPSEHEVDGSLYIMEMHLVHQSADGTLAVVGVFIELGDKHRELEKIWANLPAHDHDTSDVEDFNLNKILPEEMESYRYAGSLTTPPCTEGVKWNVLAEPIEMSGRQIVKYINIFSGEHFPKGNARPVQPINSRVVVTDAD